MTTFNTPNSLIFSISIFDTNHLDIAMQEHLDAWITLNPEFTVVLYNDTNMLEFIHDISVYNPNILATFNALRNVVEKTDYWR